MTARVASAADEVEVARAALRTAEARLAAALEQADEDEDDPWVNPLGCCANHRPGGPRTMQQHGGPGCRWPGDVSIPVLRGAR